MPDDVRMLVWSGADPREAAHRGTATIRNAPDLDAARAEVCRAFAGFWSVPIASVQAATRRELDAAFRP